jgi:hypothetical protein
MRSTRRTLTALKVCLRLTWCCAHIFQAHTNRRRRRPNWMTSSAHLLSVKFAYLFSLDTTRPQVPSVTLSMRYQSIRKCLLSCAKSTMKFLDQTQRPPLRRFPRLVNNLDYTLAVIKEAMRLFPPAGASRDGVSGVNLTENLLPTDDTILWILHGEVNQWEKYWVRGNEFLPQRWLVPDGHELYPRPGTWRPFEVGPRNCIAQAMVLTELCVVLACLARNFSIEPAYEEWDAKRGAKGNRLVHRERAY